MRVQLSFNIRELAWKRDLETKMPITILFLLPQMVLVLLLLECLFKTPK